MLKLKTSFNFVRSGSPKLLAKSVKGKQLCRLIDAYKIFCIDDFTTDTMLDHAVNNHIFYCFYNMLLCLLVHVIPIKWIILCVYLNINVTALSVNCRRILFIPSVNKKQSQLSCELSMYLYMSLCVI